MLNVASINSLSTIDTNGESLSMVVYFQGCRKNCKNCHNPSLKAFKKQTLYTPSSLADIVLAKSYFINSVVLQGGEPLDQNVDELILFINSVHSMGLNVWVYTGYDYNEIPKELKDVVDVFVSGSYNESMRTNSFPASSNQQVVYLDK